MRYSCKTLCVRHIQSDLEQLIILEVWIKKNVQTWKTCNGHVMSLLSCLLWHAGVPKLVVAFVREWISVFGTIRLNEWFNESLMAASFWNHILFKQVLLLNKFFFILLFWFWTKESVDWYLTCRKNKTKTLEFYYFLSHIFGV